MCRFILSSVAAPAILLICVSLAQGQTGTRTRTWVAGDGSTVAPCGSIATPCANYSLALSQTAPGGEIDTLRPGDFLPINSTTVQITHAVTIDGGNAGISAIGVTNNQNGIEIVAGPLDVITIRNVTINGQANSQSPTPGNIGINFASGGALTVENVMIEHLGNNNINFVPTNQSFNGGQAGPLRLYVHNSSFLNSSTGIGVNILPGGGASPVNAVITGCNFSNNVIGVVVSGAGNFATVVNSTASGRVGNIGAVPSNTNNFGFMVQSGGRMNLESCTATNLNSGIRAVEGTITMSNCNVYNCNVFGLETGPLGVIVSYGNNHVSGNTTNGAPTSTVAPV